MTNTAREEISITPRKAYQSARTLLEEGSLATETRKELETKMRRLEPFLYSARLGSQASSSDFKRQQARDEAD